MKRLRLTNTGNLFRTIFLILILMLACLLAYTSFFMERYVLQNQIHELDRSNLQLLSQVDENISRTVSDLELQTRSFLSDQTLMLYLTNPRQARIEDTTEILKLLKNFDELSPEVSGLWLYAPFSETVLSSDGYLTTRQGSVTDGLLRLHESKPLSRSAPDLCISALLQENALYLLVDFIPAQRLGCFIFRLDAQRLLPSPDSSSLSDISTLDADGTLLMVNNQPAQETRQMALTDTRLFFTDAASARLPGQRYYSVTNQTLGWRLLMEISDSSPLYDPSTIRVLLLPSLLVLLILGAVGAYLVSVKIYRPINRLMTIIMDHSGTTVPPRNDIAYLEAAYQKTFRDNETLRGRFSTLGHNMCQYLCRQAVNGQLIEGSDTNLLLDAIPAGIYRAALVRPQSNGFLFQSSVQSSLQHSALLRLAQQMPQCLCCLEESNNALVLILSLPRDRNRPDAFPDLLNSFVKAAQKQLHCRILCGMGNDCDELGQLKTSYEQALRDLQYNSYLADDPDSATAYSLHSKMLENRLDQAIDRVTANPDSIEDEAIALAQAAEQGCYDDQDRLTAYLRVQDLFLERLLFQEGTEELPLLTANTPGVHDRADFLRFCRQALESARTLAGKKKFRYVEESKKFIQENYMNCSLSINDISAHVGISSSYFSTLFNELVQESVISYLNRTRVEQAKNLLSVTGITIKEIGFRCGFNSANVFGRVFKKYTGQTPKQFRDAGTGQSGGDLS